MPDKVGATMRDQQPRKHHYVPKFYLQGFSDTGKLQVFDRYHRRYQSKSPGGVAFERDYYTIDTLAEQDTAIIEEGYGKVETAAAPLISRLQQPCTLNAVERENLALFVAMQQARVPDTEKRIIEGTEKGYQAIARQMANITATDDRAFEASRRRFRQTTGEESQVTPADWASLATGERFRLKVTVPHDYVIKEMLELALEVASYIYRMDWTVLYTPSGRAFITSDNPFVITSPQDAPFGGIGLITSGSCLVLGDQPSETLAFGQASLKAIRFINSTVAINSDRYVIAHSRELLRRIVKTTAVDTFLTTERVSIS
jgi:hypothetical protein